MNFVKKGINIYNFAYFITLYLVLKLAKKKITIFGPFYYQVPLRNLLNYNYKYQYERFLDLQNACLIKF